MDRAEQRREGREDRIAEQGLVSLIRKLREGRYGLEFMDTPEVTGVEIIRVFKTRPETGTLCYDQAFSLTSVADPKDLVIAIAITFRAFQVYEAGILAELQKRQSITGNGHQKIILTDGKG